MFFRRNGCDPDHRMGVVVDWISKKTWQLSDLVTNGKDWNWIWKGIFFVDLEMFTHRDILLGFILTRVIFIPNYIYNASHFCVFNLHSHLYSFHKVYLFSFHFSTLNST